MRLVDGWYIPDDDGSFRSNKNPIRQQMANDAGVIPKALQYFKGRECVIQAGARVGLWPSLLAEHFKLVITFEPETRNYECAAANLAQNSRIVLLKAALGETKSTKRVEFSKDTSGSHQIVEASADPSEACDVTTIDDVGISPDAIFLDIEGFELFALKGGEQTIKAARPVLVLEENRAQDRYGIRRGELAQWLKKFGYRVVDRHYRDLILTTR